MKKVMSLVAMFAMSTMLAGCYSKACEEPMPMPVAPVPYKDSAPVMMQEEVRPVHHYRARHYRGERARHHHYRKHHRSTVKSDMHRDNMENNAQEKAPADNTPQ